MKRPAKLPVSLARVHVHRADARLALHVAAPVELAVAALLQRGLQSIVSPAAAHQVAAVHAWRGAIARATCCAERTLEIQNHSLVFIKFT